MQLSSVCKYHIVDLGKKDSELAGIFSVASHARKLSNYVHSQFLEMSERYAEAYTANDYFRSLLNRALDKTKFKNPEERKIIEYWI